MAIIVNGERIDDVEIEMEVERLRPSYEKIFADKSREERETELLAWSQENLIERALFRQELNKDNRNIAPAIIDDVFEKLSKEHGGREDLLKAFAADEQGVRSMIERYTKERLLIHEIGQSAPAPTGAQIREYYEQHQDKYVMGEAVRVVHIIRRIDSSADKATALDVMMRISTEIHSGTPFESIASKYGDSIDDVEDLGYIFRGRMPGEFDDIVFNLGPGRVSHVFRTRLGLHIAKVYERRPPAVAPLQAIRERVVSDLADQLKDDAFAAHLDSLRSAATIEYV